MLDKGQAYLQKIFVASNFYRFSEMSYRKRIVVGGPCGCTLLLLLQTRHEINANYCKSARDAILDTFLYIFTRWWNIEGISKFYSKKFLLKVFKVYRVNRSLMGSGTGMGSLFLFFFHPCEGLFDVTLCSVISRFSKIKVTKMMR